MARTQRSAPAANNVDALDNLNLDDMFDEGNDDLFNDLDIDLGNIDDITSGSAALNTPADASPLPSPAQGDSPPRRRKTKRKPKAPLMYEDKDEEAVQEPPKKKKKTTKTKKGASKKSKIAIPAAEDDISKSSQGSSKQAKSKARPSVTMPSPVVRATSTPGSSVAAAGQFGRRSGSGSFSLPKSRNKLPTRSAGEPKAKAKAPAAAIPLAAPLPPDISPPSPERPCLSPATVANNLAQIISTHPGLSQNPFCGLLPSDTVFYPFMPSLPADLTLKNRKVYALIERIHSSFMSLQGPRVAPSGIISAKETDAIFKLVQEAHKDSTTGTTNATGVARAQSIGSAIGGLRKTVSQFDRTRLAGDLYALCSLLNRQHEFLKQNMENMEKWCKGNLPEEEYSAVYLPPRARKRKISDAAGHLSVLGSFNTSKLKVQLICDGFKEPPKGSSTLVALLPPLFTPPSPEPVVKPSPPKSKKRKVETVKASVPSVAPTVVKEKVVAYADCKPAKRRKLVSDLIARTARELESRFLQQQDERRQIASRQESELQKLVEEDDVPLNTLGMWRWLEKSNIFASSTEEEVRDRLEVARCPQALQDSKQQAMQKGISEVEPAAVRDESLFDRLTSLLVEEDNISGEEDYIDDIAEDSILYENEDFDDGESLVDLSALSLEERSALHLRSCGLLEDFKSMSCPLTEEYESSTKKDTLPLPENSASMPTTDKIERQSVNGNLSEERSDVEEILGNMTRDLVNLDTLNERRAAFLESLALSEDYSAECLKRKKEKEVATITKCHNLLKRNRDFKVKSGKAKAAKDEFALPW
jgi:hypothetical protein